MPNHVRNVLKFSKLTETERQFIIDQFTTETDEDGIYPLNRAFDFNRVIAEPEVKEACPEDCLVNKDSRIERLKDRPWFDWYNWHVKYWGTKWNAYDGYMKVGKTTITFVFSTAWSIPLPIYEHLAKYFIFKFEVKYADEDIGSNCGVIQFGYNSKKSGLDHYREHDLVHPVDFAKRIWNNY